MRPCMAQGKVAAKAIFPFGACRKVHMPSLGAMDPPGSRPSRYESHTQPRTGSQDRHHMSLTVNSRPILAGMPTSPLELHHVVRTQMIDGVSHRIKVIEDPRMVHPQSLP